MPGKGVTSEPVAIKMFFVLMVVVLPSSAATSTSLGLLILPHPLAYDTYTVMFVWAFVWACDMESECLQHWQVQTKVFVTTVSSARM